MSGRFFNGRRSRIFNPFNLGSRRPNFQKRMPVRRQTFVNYTKQKRKRNNNNRPIMSYVTSNVQTFRVYVGTLTKAGMVIQVGPHTDFIGTAFFQASRNFNNYLPLSVALEFNPLLNQTQAVSMVNAYLTVDPKATIPTDDVDMKNSTINHHGAEWFAANRKRINLPISTLKQNTYETGSGDVDNNTPYETAALIIVKPTSLTDDKLAVGEVYITITVRFTAPAVPIPQTQVKQTDSIAYDKIITVADTTSKVIVKDLCASGAGDYYALADKSNTKVLEKKLYAVKTDDDPKTAYDSTTGTADCFLLTKSTTGSTTSGFKIFDWKKPSETDDKYDWVERASTVVNVNILNRVVTANSSVVTTAGNVAYVNKASSIPINNQPTEDSDFYSSKIYNNVVPANEYTFQDGEESVTITATSVPINNQPVDGSDYYSAKIYNPVVPVNSLSYREKPDDDEETVLTATSIPIHCKNVEDVDDMPVNVMRQPIDVNVKNESIPVEILDQPISVKQEKSTEDWITEMIEAGAMAIL